MRKKWNPIKEIDHLMRSSLTDARNKFNETFCNSCKHNLVQLCIMRTRSYGFSRIITFDYLLVATRDSIKRLDEISLLH